MTTAEDRAPAPADKRRRNLRTIIVYVQDLPGVLNRVTALFGRRAYNIDSLTVGRTETPGVSRITIVTEADDAATRLIEANLYKLVNVLRVEDVTFIPNVRRDLALIKVKATPENREQVLQVCNVFRARVVDISTNAVILEVTGTDSKMQGLLDVLEPFGIVSMVRTGTIAMPRGEQAPSIDPPFVNATVGRSSL